MDVARCRSSAKRRWLKAFPGLILLQALMAAAPAWAQPALVKDIRPGTDRFEQIWIDEMVSFPGGVVFAGEAGAAGNELWKSNGTRAGTSIVRDILPTRDSYGPDNSAPSNLTRRGGIVLFFSFTPGAGGELLRTDGMAAGNSVVKDVWPGSGSGGGMNMGQLNWRGFFAGDDGLNDGLWKRDGRAGGTIHVKSFTPTGPGPDAYVAAGWLIFFSGYDPD